MHFFGGERKKISLPLKKKAGDGCGIPDLLWEG